MSEELPDRLPDDIARCFDCECPLRLHCRRWLDRLYGGPRTPHVDTLRTAGECERFLDAEGSWLPDTQGAIE